MNHRIMCLVLVSSLSAVSSTRIEAQTGDRRAPPSPQALTAAVDEANKAAKSARDAASGAIAAAQEARVAHSPASAASATQQNIPHLGKDGAYIVTAITLVVMILSLALVASGLYRSRQVPGERDWRLADAMSEEVTLTNPSGQPQAQLVASASRLIAVFGMVVILAFYIGVGFVTLWDLAITGTVPDALSAVMKLLAAGGSLFAPYLFNQIRAGLERRPAPPPSTAPSAASTATSATAQVQSPPIAPGMTV